MKFHLDDRHAGDESQQPLDHQSAAEPGQPVGKAGLEMAERKCTGRDSRKERRNHKRFVVEIKKRRVKHKRQQNEVA